MVKIKVEIHLENPEFFYFSLLPDIGLRKNINERLVKKKNKLVYEVDGKNFSHLKASINTLLSLIEMLKKVEKNVNKR